MRYLHIWILYLTTRFTVNHQWIFFCHHLRPLVGMQASLRLCDKRVNDENLRNRLFRSCAGPQQAVSIMHRNDCFLYVLQHVAEWITTDGQCEVVWFTRSALSRQHEVRKIRDSCLKMEKSP